MMFSKQEVARFGWHMVCCAVKDVLVGSNRQWQAKEVADQLDVEGFDVHRSELVTLALHSLKRQGEPLRVNDGGWWRLIED